MFLTDNHETLTAFEQSLCEGSVTESECLKALKSMKNNKTYGIDGFPAEFYKFFWTDMKEIVLDSLKYSLLKSELSVDHRRDIISVIPKKDKDILRLKNWRPITLLTTDYKLIAKTLSLRITKVIDKLISTDHTGYIKDSYIGENICTVHDIISYLEFKKQPGILLLIDFEKEFDSVRWKLIDEALIFFNFGASFCNWVNILYKNIKSTSCS